MTRTDERGDLGRRTVLDRSVAQIRGVDRLARWCADALHAQPAGTGSRENALDASRRRDVVERQRQAMCDRVDAQPDEPTPGTAPTAVLAHRNDWFAGSIAAALAAARVMVVARVSNGADAVGICAAEQPDLLLIEDQLPMLPGPAAVLAVREFSPGTRVVAQVGYAERIGDLLDAGAAAAFARRVPPADVAAALIELAADPAR